MINGWKSTNFSRKNYFLFHWTICGTFFFDKFSTSNAHFHLNLEKLLFFLFFNFCTQIDDDENSDKRFLWLPTTKRLVKAPSIVILPFSHWIWHNFHQMNTIDKHLHINSQILVSILIAMASMSELENAKQLFTTKTLRQKWIKATKTETQTKCETFLCTTMTFPRLNRRRSKDYSSTLLRSSVALVLVCLLTLP